MTDAPIVVVRGEVFREVPPEIARFSVTVSARDRDRQVVLIRLAERAEAIRSLIDGYGAAIERRETGQLWVRPEFKGSGERIAAYLGNVTTTVTVTDFGRLGELMLRLAGQGEASVAGPWWELRPGSPVHREARRAAVGDAIARAREYADALGAEVTALLQLSDNGPVDRPMMAVASFGTMRAGAGEPPELQLDPQPQSVHAVVEARFTITRPRLEDAGSTAG
ncbi:SIMPL domain-containing protein [Plantactinospora sp. CA-290183]|uniref:SIMPL domain-containing protein n=1 Tax=Plantactinospora sp. CA-290183 TaxID=3240006 RepID=UPI003D913E09